MAWNLWNARNRVFEGKMMEAREIVQGTLKFLRIFSQHQHGFEVGQQQDGDVGRDGIHRVMARIKLIFMELITGVNRTWSDHKGSYR